MKVKFNGELSDFHSLVGGGPQGTLIGQLEYLVQSNDNANIVCPEDRLKYIDDLSVLVEYNFHEHVASDVGTDQLFLPPSSYSAKDKLNYISNWTKENLMKLNESKCSYMVFTRTQTDFTTRLTINNSYLQRIEVQKILGVGISKDISLSKNCKKICKKAYSRLSMLTKLKYAGVSLDDLLNIYLYLVCKKCYRVLCCGFSFKPYCRTKCKARTNPENMLKSNFGRYVCQLL